MALLCNNAELTQQDGIWQADGDPTETALALAAAECGLIPGAVRESFPRVGEFPFDSMRKRMSTVHRLPSGRYRVIVKGAPELLLPLCDRFRTGSTTAALSAEIRNRALQENDRMSANALRVIGIAYQDVSAPPVREESAESHLTLAGFCGMIDPPRPEVKNAVNTCRSAGIRPVMITGDNASTAAAIAVQIGILRGGDTVISGSQLDTMTQKELEQQVHGCSVFARVSPEHKVRIVRALQRNGNVVAMERISRIESPIARKMPNCSSRERMERIQ